MSAAGLSKVRLGRMHEVMAGHVERGDVPGLVTLLSRRGEVHVDAIGMKAVGGRDPMRRDTIFRIASMTKPITAAAAMILVEECKLRLDEPVDRLLPELADRKVLKRFDGSLDDTLPANRPISVRDLLTFRLGIGAVMAPPGRYAIQEAMTEAGLAPGPDPPSHAPHEWIKRLGGLPLIHQPGERWMYHTGSDILGVLIARASGQTLETFFCERLFEPLGMKDTGFHVPPEKLDRLPPTYMANAKTGALTVHDDPRDSRWGRPPAFPAGGGGHLLRGQHRLGARHVRSHPARRSGRCSRTVRLGRRPGNIRVLGPQGRHDRNIDDPAPLGFPRASSCLSRFLDLSLPGHRRLSGRRNMTSTADREIVTTRVVDAPRERVWRAWTDREQVAQWWGPNGFTNTIHEMDLRPGGVWRFVMHGPDGTDYKNKIIYEEIVKPERLAYLHESGPKFHLTATFEEQGGKTKLTMRMLFDTAEERDRTVKVVGAVEGAKQTLGRLVEHVAKMEG